MNEDMKHIMEIEKVKKEADRLMINKIEYYEKEMALVREQCQVELLQKDKKISDLVDINVEHQKLNGELREDNKKLAKQIDDYVSKLRKAGLI